MEIKLHHSTVKQYKLQTHLQLKKTMLSTNQVIQKCLLFRLECGRLEVHIYPDHVTYKHQSYGNV